MRVGCSSKRKHRVETAEDPLSVRMLKEKSTDELDQVKYKALTGWKTADSAASTRAVHASLSWE